MKEKTKKNKEWFKKLGMLTLTFLKIGAFTFGGGYAMISLIEKDVVEKKKWLSGSEMLDIVAIAESTPGVIALNSATFVGAKVCGFWGALLASIAVLLPAMIIISLITPILDTFGSNQYVKWAFYGIRSAVAALVLNAVFKLSKQMAKSLFSYIVFGVSLVLALLSGFDVIKLDIVFIILASAVAGVVYGYIVRKKREKSGNKDGEVK